MLRGWSTTCTAMASTQVKCDLARPLPTKRLRHGPRALPLARTLSTPTPRGMRLRVTRSDDSYCDARVLERRDPQVQRRAFLRSGLLGLGASALLSCTRSPRSLEDGSTLRVAAGLDRYNTSKGRFTFTSSRPNVHVAKPPVRPDDVFQAQPWLFLRWSYEGRGRYVARLRDGMRFHDGAPLDADSFIASAKQFIAPRDSIGLDAESLHRVDDTTVSFQSLTGSASMVKRTRRRLGPALTGWCATSRGAWSRSSDSMAIGDRRRRTSASCSGSWQTRRRAGWPFAQATSM